MEIFYTIATFLLPFLVYLFQLALTLVVALAFSFIPFFIIKRSVNNAFIISFVLSVILVFSGFYYLSNNPYFICKESQKLALTDEVKAEILAESAGFYSNSLPIFPIYIEIDSINSKVIRYSTKYLYFGSTYTEITIGNGVSTELILY